MNKEELEKSIQLALKEKVQDRAEALSREAVSAYPEEPFGYAYLAEAILMQYPVPYDKAEYCLAKASQLAPQNTSYIARFAHLKAKQGDQDNAQLLWGKVIRLEPTHLDALINRGLYFLEQNADFNRAIEIFDQAIQHHLESALSYCYRAVAYLGLKEYEKSINDYNHYVKLRDNQEEEQDLLLKARILRGLEQYDTVVETYLRLSDLQPEEAFYCTQCADVLIAIERYEEAIKQYEKAILLIDPNSPQYPNTAFALGEAFYQNKQYQKAIDAFEIFVQHSDMSIIGVMRQIDTYIQLQQYQKALEEIEAAQAQNSDAMRGEELSKMQGEVLLELGQYQKAYEILHAIISRNSIYIDDARYLIGKIHLNKGALHKAYASVKVASYNGHQKATEFLQNNDQLQDFVYNLQEQNLKNSVGVIAENSNSAFVKKISGKVWCFDSFKNASGSNEAEEELLEELAAKMACVSLSVTPKGILVVMPNSVELSAYAMAESTANGMDVDVMALDQTMQSEVQLDLNADGQLEYTVNGNKERSMLLKETVLEDIRDNTKEKLKQYTKHRNVTLLDGYIKELANYVWGK
ncbi:MAG: tetratricopeptide repeat protein [Aureispira sp.]